MDTLKSVLRIALGIALLAVLLPLFVWIGLAAVGLALVGGVVAAIAGNRMMKKARTEGGFREFYYERTSRTSRNQSGNGVIIDHE